MSFLFVKIYHGPCHTFDTYIHKPHLLAGLRGWPQKPILRYLQSADSDIFHQVVYKKRESRMNYPHRLQKVGFRVCLVPVSFTNYCMIEMCGHEVFRCNLKHLKFNTCYERDTVAQRAIEAVVTSAVKFRRGRACLWFWTLLNHQMFRRNKYEPKDYWLKEVDLTSFPTCTECMDCCNILIREEPKPEMPKPETYFKL